MKLELENSNGDTTTTITTLQHYNSDILTADTWEYVKHTDGET